jgi:hypothetical protein
MRAYYKYYYFLSTEIRPYLEAKKKPLSRQIIELWRLWRHYRCRPVQYFKSRLYENGSSDYLDYVPAKVIEHFQEVANPAPYLYLTRNKFETAKVLRAAGIRCAGTILLVDQDGALTDGSGSPLSSIEEALALLAEGPEDLFIKPIDGLLGRGASVTNKSNINAEFLRTAKNILIQPRLKNHPDLEKIFSGSLNSVRIDTLIDGSDVLISGACLKIGTGTAVVDNWDKGSIAIRINLEDGSLASTGINKISYGRRVFEAHPDTNVKFEGIVVPFWAEILDMARRAARAIRPHVTLGWDIAITPEGPVVLEANDNWDFILLQDAVGPLGKSRLAQLARERWPRRA